MLSKDHLMYLLKSSMLSRGRCNYLCLRDLCSLQHFCRSALYKFGVVNIVV